jgi:hypothetical protein
MANHSLDHAGSKALLDLREMWSALLDLGWTSIALVPTEASVSVQGSVDALHASLRGVEDPPLIIDARGAGVPEGKKCLGELQAALSSGSRAVVLVDSLIQSPVGVHLVQGVDSVVLAVHVGEMDLEALTSSVAIIGTDRILGSFTAPSSP